MSRRQCRDRCDSRGHVRLGGSGDDSRRWRSPEPTRSREQSRVHRRRRQRPRAARRRDGNGEGDAGRERRPDRCRRLRHQSGRARRRADRPAAGQRDIDEIPILGRKVTTVPLFNSAFRQGKGTGDLFVNATYFITAAGSRRTTTFMLDGASNDEAWGRQTMLATVPIGAVQEVSVLANAFSAEFGWTSGPALNMVTKTGTNAVRGEALYLGRPGGAQATTFSTTGSVRRRCRVAPRRHARSDQSGGCARRAQPGLRIDRRSRSSRTRRSSSSLPITRTRTGRRTCRARCPPTCSLLTAA